MMWRTQLDFCRLVTARCAAEMKARRRPRVHGEVGRRPGALPVPGKSDRITFVNLLLALLGAYTADLVLRELSPPISRVPLSRYLYRALK